MQSQYEALPLQPLSALAGLFIITEDSLSVAQLVAHMLQQQGASAVILPQQTLQSPQMLPETVDALRQQHGSVQGIVHLVALDQMPKVETLAAWRQTVQIQAKSLFHLLHLCAPDLQQHQGRVLAASCLGGCFGRTATDVSGSPIGGASSGLLKTLVAECSNVQAKAVDFDRTLTAAEIAERVMQELRLTGGRLEVGYPQGQRVIFRTVPAPLLSTASPGWTPSAEAVVLATGGARGITAEIVADLAAFGLTLIVTGHSPVPSVESQATVEVTSVPQLRQVLLRQAAEQGTTPTPMQIERQLQALLRDRAVRQNLERFRQLGARVEYLSADVRDMQAFGSLIDGIYDRYGRLDAVIHGAGIIEDKLIVDKRVDSFDRVFDTKADSAFILSRYLRPDSLKLLVFFTSVAGRYGNRGQSDYAAANEVVNRLVWQLKHRWSGPRIVAINWGPWETTGMASEEVKRQFRDRGIVPIPLQAGRAFFTAEVQRGHNGDVEVIAGEGPWEAYETQLGQLESLQPPAKPIAPSLNDFVLLLQQPQLQANSTVTLDYTLSIASDPALQDHCLDGKPVLPAAGALEWLAEFVQASWSDWVVAEVRGLQVLRGLVLATPAGRTIRLKARAASHADAESLQVSAEIVDPDRDLPFYRATVILQPALEAPLALELPGICSNTGLDPHVAYRDYLFHGPQFQLVTAIERFTEQGIDAQVEPCRVAAWRPLASNQARWLFDPGLVDTAPQMAIVWSRLHRNTTALPSRMGRVIRYGTSCLQAPLQLQFRVTHASEHTLTYDAAFVDAAGKVRLHMQQIESTCNSALNRLATCS